MNNKFYIAPTRKGRMLKIVEDVKIPISDKLYKLGLKQEDYIVRPRLIARFTNEEECKEWLKVYQDYIEKKYLDNIENFLICTSRMIKEVSHDRK